MTPIIDRKKEFLDKVRNKEYFYFYRSEGSYYHDKSMWDFRWDNLVYLIDTHPEQFLKQGSKNNINLTSLEKRGSTPQFSKNFIEDLKTLFPKNNITSHIFAGIGKHQSFEIHKDKMDVLYLQVMGTVDLSIWKSKTPTGADNLSKEEADCITTQSLRIGHLVWIPRGTFHLIEPSSSRVAFSFGVEGQDPSTYV